MYAIDIDSLRKMTKEMLRMAEFQGTVADYAELLSRMATNLEACNEMLKEKAPGEEIITLSIHHCAACKGDHPDLAVFTNTESKQRLVVCPETERALYVVDDEPMTKEKLQFIKDRTYLTEVMSVDIVKALIGEVERSWAKIEELTQTR